MLTLIGPPDDSEDRGSMLVEAAQRAITKAKAEGDSATVQALQDVYGRAAIYLRRFAAYQEARGALQDARGAFALSRDLYHGDDIATVWRLAEGGLSIIPVEAFDGMSDADDLLEGANLFEALADACR